MSAARLGIEPLVAAWTSALAIFLAGDGIRPDVLARTRRGSAATSRCSSPSTRTSRSRPGWSPATAARSPSKYRRTHDPFVALAFAAAATEKLHLGTSVCLVIEHDPIVLAKVGRLARRALGGRFVFGVGAGWNKPEMLNHGTDPATRHGNMRERVEAMKAIWTRRRGRVPRQARRLRPDLAVAEAAAGPVPVYVGGNGPRVEDRVLRYGDGWMPNMQELETLAPRVAALRERAGPRRPRDLLRRDAREPRTRCATRAWTAR